MDRDKNMDKLLTVQGAGTPVLVQSVGDGTDSARPLANNCGSSLVIIQLVGVFQLLESTKEE